MTPEEAIMLCRYVKACCPQQAIDEHTPLAWADHLADVPYVDAKAAAKQITAKQPFVTIAEILTIVRQMRAKRVAEAGDLVPPPEARDGDAYHRWLAEARRRIADGEDVTPNQGELKPRHMPDLRQLLPAPTVHPEPEDDA